MSKDRVISVVGFAASVVTLVVGIPVIVKWLSPADDLIGEGTPKLVLSLIGLVPVAAFLVWSLSFLAHDLFGIGPYIEGPRLSIGESLKSNTRAFGLTALIALLTTLVSQIGLLAVLGAVVLAVLVFGSMYAWHVERVEDARRASGRR